MRTTAISTYGLTLFLANFRSSFQVALASFNEAGLKPLMVDCANQLGLAYNHQSAPRCFKHGTEEFPWGNFDPHKR
jgi:hypothetical protein